uniref:Uncharacterized protein n=1 Tax=Dendroctonus ponderosae TaxID=77166 RepID=J3JU65_DENPD|nr:unknown [Dendroctonus ponderosae]
MIFLICLCYSSLNPKKAWRSYCISIFYCYPIFFTLYTKKNLFKKKFLSFK